MSQDDRMMEVEGFENGGQHERDGNRDAADSFELAASKPINSSRIMNRRMYPVDSQNKQYGTLQMEASRRSYKVGQNEFNMMR
jgi:hypothetical protein